MRGQEPQPKPGRITPPPFIPEGQDPVPQSVGTTDVAQGQEPDRAAFNFDWLIRTRANALMRDKLDDLGRVVAKGLTKEQAEEQALSNLSGYLQAYPDEIPEFRRFIAGKAGMPRGWIDSVDNILQPATSQETFDAWVAGKRARLAQDDANKFRQDHPLVSGIYDYVAEPAANFVLSKAQVPVDVAVGAANLVPGVSINPVDLRSNLLGGLGALVTGRSLKEGREAAMLADQSMAQGRSVGAELISGVGGFVGMAKGMAGPSGASTATSLAGRAAGVATRAPGTVLKTGAFIGESAMNWIFKRSKMAGFKELMQAVGRGAGSFGLYEALVAHGTDEKGNPVAPGVMDRAKSMLWGMAVGPVIEGASLAAKKALWSIMNRTALPAGNQAQTALDAALNWGKKNGYRPAEHEMQDQFTRRLVNDFIDKGLPGINAKGRKAVAGLVRSAIEGVGFTGLDVMDSKYRAQLYEAYLRGDGEAMGMLLMSFAKSAIGVHLLHAKVPDVLAWMRRRDPVAEAEKLRAEQERTLFEEAERLRQEQEAKAAAAQKEQEAASGKARDRAEADARQEKWLRDKREAEAEKERVLEERFKQAQAEAEARQKAWVDSKNSGDAARSKEAKDQWDKAQADVRLRSDEWEKARQAAAEEKSRSDQERLDKDRAETRQRAEEWTQERQAQEVSDTQPFDTTMTGAAQRGGEEINKATGTLMSYGWEIAPEQADIKAPADLPSNMVPEAGFQVPGGSGRIKVNMPGTDYHATIEGDTVVPSPALRKVLGLEREVPLTEFSEVVGDANLLSALRSKILLPGTPVTPDGATVDANGTLRALRLGQVVEANLERAEGWSPAVSKFEVREKDEVPADQLDLAAALKALLNTRTDLTNADMALLGAEIDTLMGVSKERDQSVAETLQAFGMLAEAMESGTPEQAGKAIRQLGEMLTVKAPEVVAKEVETAKAEEAIKEAVKKEEVKAEEEAFTSESPVEPKAETERVAPTMEVGEARSLGMHKGRERDINLFDSEGHPFRLKLTDKGGRFTLTEEISPSFTDVSGKTTPREFRLWGEHSSMKQALAAARDIAQLGSEERAAAYEQKQKTLSEKSEAPEGKVWVARDAEGRVIGYSSTPADLPKNAVKFAAEDRAAVESETMVGKPNDNKWVKGTYTVGVGSGTAREVREGMVFNQVWGLAKEDGGYALTHIPTGRRAAKGPRATEIKNWVKQVQSRLTDAELRSTDPQVVGFAIRDKVGMPGATPKQAKPAEQLRYGTEDVVAADKEVAKLAKLRDELKEEMVKIEARLEEETKGMDPAEADAHFESDARYNEVADAIEVTTRKLVKAGRTSAAQRLNYLKTAAEIDKGTKAKLDMLHEKHKPGTAQFEEAVHRLYNEAMDSPPKEMHSGPKAVFDWVMKKLGPSFSYMTAPMVRHLGRYGDGKVLDLAFRAETQGQMNTGRVAEDAHLAFKEHHAIRNEVNEIVTSAEGNAEPKWLGIYEGRVKPENAQQKAAANAANKAGVTMFNMIADAGGVRTTTDADGNVIYERMKRTKRVTFPRFMGREHGDVFGPADVRMRYFQRIAERNPKQIRDSETGQLRQRTAADLEKQYLERRVSDNQITGVEKETAAEFVREEHNIDYVFEGKEVWETNFQSVMEQMVRTQPQRAAFLEYFGPQGLPDDVRERLGFKDFPALRDLQVEYTRSLNANETEAAVLDQQLKDYLQALQGRQPALKKTWLNLMMRKLQPVESLVRAALVGVKAAIYDLPAAALHPFILGESGEVWRVLYDFTNPDSFVNNRKDAFEHAFRIGAITRAMVSHDPAVDSPSLRGLNQLARWATKPAEWSEQLKGAMADHLARHLIERWEQGKVTEADMSLVDLLHLAPEVLQPNASQFAKDQFRLEFAKQVTARTDLASASAMAMDPGMRMWVRFLRWASRAAHNHARVFSMIKQAKTPAQRQLATERVMKMAGIYVASGALGQALIYLFQDMFKGENGLKRFWREWSYSPEHAVGMAMKAYASQVTGGFFSTAAGFVTEPTAENMARIAAPLQYAYAAAKAGTTLWDTISQYAAGSARKDPGAVAEVINAFGVIPLSRELIHGASALMGAAGGYYQLDRDAEKVRWFKRMEGIESASGQRKWPQGYYAALQSMQRRLAANGGDGVKTINESMDDFRAMLALAPQESVAQAIRQHQLLSGLSAMERDKMAQKMDDPELMRRMYQYDHAMRQMAKVVSEIEGTPQTAYAEELEAVKRQASLGASDKWHGMAERAVDDAVNGEIENLQLFSDAMATFMEHAEEVFTPADAVRIARRESVAERSAAIERLLEQRVKSRKESQRRQRRAEAAAERRAVKEGR